MGYKRVIWTCVVITIAVVLGYLVHRGEFFLMRSEGASMAPCYAPGEMRKVYPNRTPHIGEGIAFKCLVDKCVHPDTNTFSKIVKKEKEDCIWVEGCSKNSFDSRIYGWLCGNEYKLIGLVQEL